LTIVKHPLPGYGVDALVGPEVAGGPTAVLNNYYVIDSISEIGDIDDETEGDLLYVKDTDAFYRCSEENIWLPGASQIVSKVESATSLVNQGTGVFNTLTSPAIKTNGLTEYKIDYFSLQIAGTQSGSSINLSFREIHNGSPQGAFFGPINVGGIITYNLARIFTFITPIAIDAWQIQTVFTVGSGLANYIAPHYMTIERVG
jgi:hypothetical protein